MARRSSRSAARSLLPGNVPGLDHVNQRAVALAASDTIRHLAFAPAAGGGASGCQETRDIGILGPPVGNSGSAKMASCKLPLWHKPARQRFPHTGHSFHNQPLSKLF
jgi:hypothetical protein